MRLFRAVTLALIAASSSSCFAVTDLDRFESSKGSTSNFNDLRLSVRGMTSHVKELFEYRVVDATNTIQSRGFIVPLGDTKATLFVPGAVPKQNGPFNLDFYADHDNSGGYDTDPANAKDHAWRLPLTADRLDDEDAYSIVFDHNTSFSFLANPAPPRTYGGPATVRLSNMGALAGKRVEIRIADASSKRVVGLYRIPSFPAATAAAPATPASVSIEGMIEGGVTYAVEVYTDDGNATPGTIRSFRMEVASNASGLVADFDPATAPVVTDVASP